MGLSDKLYRTLRLLPDSQHDHMIEQFYAENPDCSQEKREAVVGKVQTRLRQEKELVAEAKQELAELKAQSIAHRLETYILYLVQRNRITQHAKGPCAGCQTRSFLHLEDFGY